MSKAIGQFFLWSGSAMYIGLGQESGLHRHYMLQLGLSQSHPFNIGTASGDAVPMTGFLVAKNTVHRVGAGGVRGVFIWVDPDSVRGWLLRQVLSARRTELLPLEIVSPACAEAQSLTCKAARNLCETILDAIVPLTPDKHTIDERIARLQAVINSPTYLRNPTSIQRLADTVFLSGSWLRHLFRKHTELSIQQYILWARVRRAVECLSAGASITEAAHEAGFSDSAHLSRTFRRSFGLSPSDVFQNTIETVLCP